VYNLVLDKAPGSRGVFQKFCVKLKSKLTVCKVTFALPTGSRAYVSLTRHQGIIIIITLLIQSVTQQTVGFIANAEHKIQGLLKDFQGPKYAFSSTKIIEKQPYPTCGTLKFMLQCDTEPYCFAITSNVMIKAGVSFKIVNKFHNLDDLNSSSRIFQGLSSTLSVFKHFQGP